MSRDTVRESYVRDRRVIRYGQERGIERVPLQGDDTVYSRNMKKKLFTLFIRQHLAKRPDESWVKKNLLGAQCMHIMKLSATFYFSQL